MKLFDFLDSNLSAEKHNLKSETLAEDEEEADEEFEQNDDETKLGISTKEAEEKLARYGKNELKHKKKASAIALFFNQYKDIMTIILLVCTAISVTMGDFVEAIAIAIIVLMNGILGFLQEFKTEKTLDALKSMASPMARVYRDGTLFELPSDKIVRGDVVYLEAGDKIPADGNIIACAVLNCDEAMLTGESKPVKKTVGAGEESTVYMGCIVTTGHGTFRVTKTGMSTKMGGIASMLQEIDEEQTPLQRRLAKLSKAIAIGCLAICAIVTVTGIMRGEPFMQMLITGVSLAVAAVPEGLPAIVTISLALSVSRMVKRNALVRRLHAVETLGCATVICSDKTGTLTQNKMTVTKVYTTEGIIKADKFTEKNANSGLLFKAMKLCNNATLSSKLSAKGENYGDPTEICLLQFVKKNAAPIEGYSRIDEQPFDSNRKRMSVVVRDGNGQQYMFAKGAFDILLEKCTAKLEIDGSATTLSAADKIKLEEQNNAMADAALRVMCIAFKKINPLNDAKSEEGLTFIGLVGMIDPPRKEAKSAVLNCHKAGIKTIMITGDHKKTAVAIAKEVGIYHDGDKVLTGHELDLMEFDELTSIVNNVTVFARVNPNHKLTIVRALKRHGHIVAMTGDGVNDAPAIKEADIGVSMGKNGTDVTREASDIILLDDNFATLVNAVDEGRSIYNNIRKFIRYLLSCNIGEVITMFLGMLMGMPIVLLPIQILLVNLVTDGLPAIALGLEPADKRAMSIPPRKTGESIFSNGLATKIIVRGILIGLTTLCTFVTVYNMSGSEITARSATLFALIFAQLIHVFECKSEEKGIFSIPYFNNIKLVLAALSSLAVLLLVLYVPALQLIFSTVALNATQLLIPIVFCLLAPIVSGLLHWKMK